MTFTFIPGPNGQGMTDQDFLASAFDQPMSLGSTFWDQAKGGLLDSFGLGTAVRSFSLPISPDEQRQAGVEPTAALTQEQYKASPYFRDNVPWDANMTEDRAAALADMSDAKKVREFYSQKRPITAFFGSLAGSATDPINYIPFAGEAVIAANTARFGRLAGRALTSAFDAAANTAVAGALTSQSRGSLGDDVSLQTTVSQIAMAALIGGAFGAVQGSGIGGRIADRVRNRFGRELPDTMRADIQERLATLDNVQTARVALNDAIDGLVRNGEVRLSETSTSFANDMASEISKLSRAYDSVRANPSGPVNDPLVAITPDDIEGTILARGAFQNVNEAEFSKRGWGLVKMIWRHGEESREAPEFQVSKDDVLALPQVVREYEPSSVSANGRQREWRVERDGRTLVYADSKIGDQRHVVTTYVQRSDAPGADAALSAKRKPVATSSPDEPLKPVGDTAQQPLPSSTGGQSLPATYNIMPELHVDNGVPVEQFNQPLSDAQKRVGTPETYRAMAEQYRVDPATGDFAELPEIDQLRAEGRLTPDDEAALVEADETLKNANGYAEALKAFANCVI